MPSRDDWIGQIFLDAVRFARYLRHYQLLLHEADVQEAAEIQKYLERRLAQPSA